MKRTAYLATAASVVLMFGGPVATAAAATADTPRPGHPSEAGPGGRAHPWRPRPDGS
ncbi:hypothetical protein [Streptomyces sp. H27-S2]|uniref:hypothetical protein n=1 Tax=Streptomyces antarcticus TaxID=2996458 RepID=UPI002270F5E0|nr:hypothetical protein [Streptomyces sp. H27-S2]